jgi:hypothetical protein
MPLMKRKASKEPGQAWASVKMRRQFVAWLKVEAAIRGVFMGDLVEKLASEALNSSPWCEPSTWRQRDLDR